MLCVCDNVAREKFSLEELCVCVTLLRACVRSVVCGRVVGDRIACERVVRVCCV